MNKEQRGVGVLDQGNVNVKWSCAQQHNGNLHGGRPKTDCAIIQSTENVSKPVNIIFIHPRESLL